MKVCEGIKKRTREVRRWVVETEAVLAHSTAERDVLKYKVFNLRIYDEERYLIVCIRRRSYSRRLSSWKMIQSKLKSNNELIRYKYIPLHKQRSIDCFCRNC